MSLREVDPYAVIEQVFRRTMKQWDSALWLGLSVRQFRRLTQAIRDQCTAGVISRRRGVPSNRSVKQSLREPFLGLVREHYADFVPSLCASTVTCNARCWGLASAHTAHISSPMRQPVAKISHSPRTVRVLRLAVGSYLTSAASSSFNNTRSR